MDSFSMRSYEVSPRWLPFWTLALAVILILCPKCTPLDDEIYERQSESTYLATTLMEKMVKFYNLTETFQEKFNRLARYDPVGEARDNVDKLIIHTQTLAKEYRKVEKLLANPMTRDEAKKTFDNLYHKSTDLIEETKPVLKMANIGPNGHLQSNEVLTKAKEDYESLKADLEAVHSTLLNEFVDSAIVLGDKKLFPVSVYEVKDSDRLDDVEYSDSLMQLHRLYKKCHELEKKAEAANNKDVAEAFTLGQQVHELFYEVIPDFIAKNKVALSHIMAVTTDKLMIMEKQFRKINLDEALESEQQKVIHRVFDSWAETEKLNEARRAAGAVYHEYFEEISHEEREAQRQRDEL